MKKINLNLDDFNPKEYENINEKDNTVENNKNIDNKDQENNLMPDINNLLPKTNTQRIFALSILSQIIFNTLKDD